MSDEQSNYLSYLLRLWRENGEEQNTWQASLESALTHKRYVFPNLEKLFAFLQRQIGVGSDVEKGECARESVSESIE
jgi:hypothetical protein